MCKHTWPIKLILILILILILTTLGHRTDTILCELLSSLRPQTYTITTTTLHFSINLIQSSIFKFIMGLVLTLLMNWNCSVRFKAANYLINVRIIVLGLSSRQPCLVWVHPYCALRVLHFGIFKGDIGCPFSTSWYDSLGSSWNVCNILWLKLFDGRVKQHSFYLVKNISVPNKLFSVHASLNDNDLLLTPPLSSVGRVNTRYLNCCLRLYIWLGGGLIQIGSYLLRNWLQTETAHWMTQFSAFLSWQTCQKPNLMQKINK